MSEEKTVNQIEQDAIHDLEALSDQNTSKSSEALEDAKKKIKEIFDDLKVWLSENSNPETAKETLEKAKNDVKNVLDSTKEKIVEIGNSKEVQDTLEAGKDFVLGTGGILVDGLRTGADALMKNETVKAVVEKADEKLDVLRENEGLKKAVNAAEDVTEKISSSIFGRIKKILSKDEDEKGDQ